jgi:hypothetical protein
MKQPSEQLIDDLREHTLQVIYSAKALDAKSDEDLLKRPSAEAWNAIECIEHLNRYADFYHPEIRKRIDASTTSAVETFKSGLLGDKFAKSLLPRPPEHLNKMKTFAVMNPKGEVADRGIIRRFLAEQETMLKLLEDARSVHLSKVKTSISISKWIKLRLGDTFRVVIYHNQRHLQQAERAAR